jgi:signal transduction histidine kinase
LLFPAHTNRINRFVPGHLVPALLDLYRPYAAEQGVRLCHVVDADTPTLPIDTSALHRLLSNLLVNAVKHAHASQVTVSAHALADGVGVQIIVADYRCRRDHHVRTAFRRRSPGDSRPRAR